MMIRNRNPRARRGAALVEAAILYPLFLLLLLGTLVVMLGVFRHGQLASLAWESARWASVRGHDYQKHGPDYAEDKRLPAPTDQEIADNIDRRMLFGFNVDPSALVSTLDRDRTAVALNYEWRPEYSPTVGGEDDEPGEPPRRLFDSSMLLRGSVTMPTLHFRTDED